MLDRARARDRAYDGRFLTGVRTTGIYCLPSCPARTPNADNVVHFATPAQARAAGLRACLRCHPDDWYRGYDPDEELAAAVAREVAHAPAEFADAAAIAARAGVGLTKLHAVFRKFLQTTPAAFLTRARLQSAAAALRTGVRALPAALAAGFDSLSTFYANFAPQYGMTPDAYRRLASATRFVLQLPDDFCADAWTAFLARDAAGVAERVEGQRVTKALWLAGAPCVVEIELRGDRAHCRLAAGVPTAAAIYGAHAAVVRSLNFAADAAQFATRAQRTPFARLVEQRPGLRMPCAFSPFEALVWAMLGQQVNVTFAIALRRRLIEFCGTPIGDLRAHPTPAQLAAVDPAELRARQFSTRKATDVVALAHAVAVGDLSLEPPAYEPVPRLERALLNRAGVGPWTASYVLLRGLGLPDCAPVGDVGVQSALQRLLARRVRPDATATARALARYAPLRSFAVAHLWASLDAPTTARPRRLDP